MKTDADIEDTKGFKNLDTDIKTKVFGQDEAVDKLVESILVSKETKSNQYQLVVAYL